MPDCPICVRGYSKCSRVAVTCPHPDCGKQCCRSCLCTFLLTIENARCMFCGGALTNEFIRRSCSHRYWNTEHHAHRVRVIHSHEKHLLPSTQGLATAQLLRQDRNKRLLARLANRGLNEENGDDDTAMMDPASVQDSFLGHCPAKECNGMITINYTCTLCKVLICASCMTPLGSGHTCIPETVATIRTIMRDAKSCPSCLCPISKIGGCDQMWCTQCRVSFSWERGTIEQNPILHNPHYLEGIRGGGSDQVALPCLSDVDSVCRRNGIAITPHRRLASSIGLHGAAKNAIRFALNAPHILAVSYPTDMHTTYQQNRIQFLLGELSNSAWVKRISFLERKRDKNEQVRSTVGTLVATMRDILARFVASADVVEEEVMDEFYSAYDVAMNQLGTIKGVGRIMSELAALV